MEKENQRIQLTKRLLKEALIRLLRKKNLERINVAELCREAGINRATFYRHYEIPRDVLIEIGREWVADFVTENSLPQTPDESRAFIYRICAYMDQNIDLLRVVVLSNSDADLTMLFQEIYMPGIKDVIQRLNLPRPIDEEDLKLLAGYAAGGGYFVLRQWVLGNLKKSASEIAEFVCELFFSTDWRMLASQLGLPADR